MAVWLALVRSGRMPVVAYDIRFDASLRRLTVVRSGFWSCDEVDRYRTDMATALARAAATGASFDVHINLAAAAVLSSDAADRMRPVAVLLRGSGARRVAWVTDSALGRLQVRRVVDDVPNFRMFATDAEATGWFDHP